MEKFNYPEFVLLPAFLIISQPEMEMKIKVFDIKINPLSVTYYTPSIINNKDATYVAVGGQGFNIDMPFKEFEKLWAEVERNISSE